MKRNIYCFACDLDDNLEKIEEYKEYHKKIWPQINESIKNAGIVDMQIYQTGNRLFMLMEVDETFSFEQKKRMDAANAVVQKWEKLMSTFQKPLPWAEGEKWVQMECIFKL